MSTNTDRKEYVTPYPPRVTEYAMLCPTDMHEWVLFATKLEEELIEATAQRDTLSALVDMMRAKATGEPPVDQSTLPTLASLKGMMASEPDKSSEELLEEERILGTGFRSSKDWERRGEVIERLLEHDCDDGMGRDLIKYAEEELKK